MTLTRIWLFPLLLALTQSSATQTTAAAPAPNGDSICLSEILISTRPYDPAQVADARHKADSARDAIRQGAKFEDIAKKYSDGPTAAYGGALGAFKRGQLAKQIEDKVFVMKVGDVSDVIRTKQGFVVLQVTECGRATGEHGGSGSIEILSDTQGVDFGPYLQDVIQKVRQSWYHLIPESVSMKKGELAIEFAITKVGRVADMRLVASSGDVALDRPAWGSITASNPFPPLPSEFTGPYLALRFRFYYNPDKSDVVVVIFSTSDGLHVPVGGTEVVAVTVTGAKDSSVEWTVSGPGCSSSACGKMIGYVYVAPGVRPDPPYVTLTAVSKADPTAKDSVTVHIVEPTSKTASKP